MIINLARRAHDHNWELDPITRSLLDTDFYKLLMLQFIWKHFPKTRATFTLANRTSAVPLGIIVNLDELREQLESTRKLRFHKSELIWLAGNTFYGKRGIFEPDFLDWLDQRLPPLRLRALRERRPVISHIRRSVDRNNDVGDLRSLGHRRAEDARQRSST